jgi:hypothetical protein
MKRVCLAVLGFLLICPTSFAADKTLSWTSASTKGFCRNTLRFNPSKYSEGSLWDTIHLLFGPPDFEPPSVGSSFSAEQYLKFDFDELDQQCVKSLNRAHELMLVPLKGIEDYRRYLVDEVKDTCDFYRIKMQGYSAPSVLREYRPAAACTPFIDALEGKTDMMAMVRETIARSCKDNASPGRCAQDALARDPRVELLEFG